MAQSIYCKPGNFSYIYVFLWKIIFVIGAYLTNYRPHCCISNFHVFYFLVLASYENYLTAKISRFMVYNRIALLLIPPTQSLIDNIFNSLLVQTAKLTENRIVSYTDHIFLS